MLLTEHISQAFIYFDKIGFKRITSCEAEEQELEKLWHDLFKKLKPELFASACQKAVLRCRYWPKPAEVMDAIDELNQEVNSKIPEQLPAPAVKRDISKERIKKLMAAVNSGKAMQWAKEQDNTEIINFAKSRYPDMSENQILKNYLEFWQLLQSNKGYTDCKYIAYLDKKSGYIRLSVAL